jgi:hypothetical protein
MRPEAVTKKRDDQDWREVLARCVDAIRPLRGIRVPAALQARFRLESPWFWGRESRELFLFVEVPLDVAIAFRDFPQQSQRQSALA